MLALVASTLILQQALKSFEDFCVKAELQIKQPLTEESLTKTIVREEYGSVTVRIEDKYRLTWVRGRLSSFVDATDDFSGRLTRLDPADMQRWSEQPCLLDETNALVIAKRIFLRLGFDEKNFDPVEVHRYSWQPSYTNPEHMLWLPLFWVRWYQKGYSHDQALPPSVTMDISGTTKKLLHYLDATEKRKWYSFLLPSPTKTADSSEDTSPIPQSEVATCQQFLQAIGVQASGPNDPPKVGRFPGSSATLHWVLFQQRYAFTINGGPVRAFRDYSEDFQWLRMTQRYDDLRKWADHSAVISKDQAAVLASNYLRRLGFDPASHPPNVEQEQFQFEDPDQPGKRVTLPVSFLVQHRGNRPFWARNGEPGLAIFRISGATGNLVFYEYTPSTLRMWGV
jgi:hypothetical protein